MSTSRRRSASEAREEIIGATIALLTEEGAASLNVHAIMRRAGISRTAFYRQFGDVYDVVTAVLERIGADLLADEPDWFRVPGAVGSREILYGNAVQSGRAIERWAAPLGAIHDASGLDERLRTLWRDGFMAVRIEMVAAAIRRDQDAGAIRADLDADATSLALNLMSEQVGLEILSRGGGTPEDYARLVAPIWEAVLFGPSPGADLSDIPGS